ncbi:ebp domain-containing protein [Neofusicoccum parvum]|nr:ebp domain-containing protein [Neofusicoccum parvum]
MDRATLNDLITSKLPALFGCNGFLPLAADCYIPSRPPAADMSSDPVAYAASSMAESAAAAAAAFEPALEVSVELNATKIPHPSHPYYPLDVEIPGYLANDYSVPELLAIFAAGCFYVYNFRTLGGSRHLFGQLWKEYSLSDSRYLTKDPFVLCMESITAVCWGPLSFIVAHMITTEHPLRYPLQAIVSLGQLYGDVLYYATAMFDHYVSNLNYTRPESYYFWVYFVFMNAFWIVIPIILIANSVSASSRAFKALAKMERCLNASPASPKKHKTF